MNNFLIISKAKQQRILYICTVLHIKKTIYREIDLKRLMEKNYIVDYQVLAS